MEEYRYPLGQFEPIHNPTSDQRERWIEAIAETPRILRITVHTLTQEQFHTPYRLGGWTVQQVIHHLADNDMNAFLRFKRALTEDNPTAASYHEELWAELSDYQIPIEPSLAIMESVRIRFVALLRSLLPSYYQRTFVSPTHGVMNLDVATQRFAWHGQHHLAQIVSLKTRSGW